MLTPYPTASATSAARIAQRIRPVKASIAERRSRRTSSILVETWVGDPGDLAPANNLN